MGISLRTAGKLVLFTVRGLLVGNASLARAFRGRRYRERAAGRSFHLLVLAELSKLCSNVREY
jgi:hypothetical protein